MTRPAVKVEVAFGSTMFSASPSWTDISDYFMALTSDRGRSSVASRFDTGTATLVLDNTDGRFTPENTSGAYHPDVQIGVPVRVTATWQTVEYPLFYGSVRAWPVDFPAGFEFSSVAVPLVDGFYSLNLEDLAGEEFTAQTTDERIAAVLDAVGWPAGLRDLDSGVGTVQASSFALPEDGGENPALNHLQDVAEAEAGALFMGADGDVKFQNRVALSGVSPTVTFDGDDYSTIQLSFDDSVLYNDVRVAREDGAQVRFVDSVSVAAHGRRVLTRDVMPMGNDSEVLNVAEWLSGVFGVQRLRVTDLMFKPLGDVTLMANLLGLELRSGVTVQLVPPNGDTVNQDCAVEQIRHEITPGDWETTLTVAPLNTLESQGYWVLGTSELDVDTRLA